MGCKETKSTNQQQPKEPELVIQLMGCKETKSTNQQQPKEPELVIQLMGCKETKSTNQQQPKEPKLVIQLMGCKETKSTNQLQPKEPELVIQLMGCKETKSTNQQQPKEPKLVIVKEVLNLKTVGRICEFDGKLAYWSYDQLKIANKNGLETLLSYAVKLVRDQKCSCIHCKSAFQNDRMLQLMDNQLVFRVQNGYSFEIGSIDIEQLESIKIQTKTYWQPTFHLNRKLTILQQSQYFGRPELKIISLDNSKIMSTITTFQKTYKGAGVYSSNLLYTIMDNGELRVWCIQRKSILKIMKIHSLSAWHINGNQQWLVTVGDDGTKIWDQFNLIYSLTAICKETQFYGKNTLYLNNYFYCIKVKLDNNPLIITDVMESPEGTMNLFNEGIVIHSDTGIMIYYFNEL